VRRRLLTLCAAAGAAVVVGAGCGDDVDAGEERAEQVRAAGEAAGLPDEVVDVLVLAAEGTDATFQVTYAGSGGAALIVSQDPPNRRVDVVSGERVVESRVVRDGTGYLCTPPPDEPDGPLACSREEGALEAPGAFTSEALDAFREELVSSLPDVDLSVEAREVADVAATCLVATPAAGPTDASGPSVEALCLSPEGAQLLVDAGGERVVAEAYSTDVPDGTFDV
jgi:hypothetical protein